jgi:glycosyltransferase involved in cell wall biosynthesis
MALISIISPVYNTEKLLPRCLDSILSQTFQDFDVVLVNDGSKDDSGKICEAYAQADNRIHVIHQKNSGVSAARNAALDWVMEHSDSQWILFVDSDDWVHPQILETLLQLVQTYQVKVSACGYLETSDGTLSVCPEQLEPQIWDAKEFYYRQKMLGTVPWGKLYAKSCFADIRYPVGSYFDDEFVTYRILLAQEKIPMVSAPMYGYYINPEGLTKRPWIIRRLDVWKAYEQQIQFFEEMGDQRLLRFRYREYIDNSYAQLLAAQSAPNAAQLTKEIRYIKKHMRKLFRRAWKIGYVEFWMDYDMLYACAPIRTKLYRLWLEIKK